MLEIRKILNISKLSFNAYNFDNRGSIAKLIDVIKKITVDAKKVVVTKYP